MAQGGKSVLVVEDDLALQEMVEEVPQDTGYRVVTAGDGHEALLKVHGMVWYGGDSPVAQWCGMLRLART